MSLLFDIFWHVVLKVTFLSYLKLKKKNLFLICIDAKGFETSTTIEINSEKVISLILLLLRLNNLFFPLVYNIRFNGY